MRAPTRAFGLLGRVEGKPSVNMIDDVVDNLTRLLNAKQGYASFRQELGLGISDLLWAQRPMIQLAAHIREQIVQFEPRLRHPHIEPEPVEDHFCPSFRIHGLIGAAEVRMVLSLHTVYCSVHVTRE
jgi:predicted component of type VI protein secretion system